MNTDSFTFSKLNYNGDVQRTEAAAGRQRIRIRSSQNHHHLSSSPSSSALSRNGNGNGNINGNASRPITMSLFVSDEIVLKPGFDPSKYVKTPRGYINRTIFSKDVPQTLANSHYLPRYSHSFVSAVYSHFCDTSSVADFILTNLRLIPCNVSIRWGVLFNLKFRRMFQCLGLEKWNELGRLFRAHGYAMTKRGGTILLDPDCKVTETPPKDDPRISSDSSATGRIDPNRTPERLNNNSSYFHRISPPPTPSIPPPVFSVPAVPTVPRSSNQSIYSIDLLGSYHPFIAERFDTYRFNSNLKLSIRRLYNSSDQSIDAILEHLRTLPVKIPLRWGVIYNKQLRVRSRAVVSKKPVFTTLQQWNDLKNLLKEHGYLHENSNCVILSNKNRQ